MYRGLSLAEKMLTVTGEVFIVLRIISKNRLHLISVTIAMLAVVLSGFLLTRAAISDVLIGTLEGFGLDPQRGHFVEMLLLTVLVGLIAALLSRQRMAVVMGALAFFSYGYLRHFLILVMQPMYDAGGLLEPLDKLALLHTLANMLGLAVLASAAGIALGLGLARVLLNPLMDLSRFVYQQWCFRGEGARKEQLALMAAPDLALRCLPLLGGLVQAALLVLAFLLAASSTNLFVYSPDIDLHLSPDQGGPQGTIVDGTYISQAMGGQRRTFVIYLPPSYNKAKDRRYPVLYLLHGSPGHQENWLTGGKAAQSENTLVQVGRAPELIMVLPDGNGRSGATSEWGNSGDGKQMLENAIVQDLVPYIDLKYRTIADNAHRGIGGLSMGGFGAVNIGVRHPDLFGFVIALGGYYYADGPIWGKNSAYLRANSPAEVLSQRKAVWKTHFFIGGATKDDLYQQSVSFSGQLKRLHIPYMFDVMPGYHAWIVWQVEFYHALQWLKASDI